MKKVNKNVQKRVSGAGVIWDGGFVGGDYCDHRDPYIQTKNKS